MPHIVDIIVYEQTPKSSLHPFQIKHQPARVIVAKIIKILDTTVCGSNTKLKREMEQFVIF